MNAKKWIQLTPEEQFALASARFFQYADVRNYGKCRKWSRRLAHAALTLHPELREEGSLERYFVARLGRERGYRGVELTAFVENAYQSGLAKFAIDAGMASGPRQVALSQVRDWLIDDSLKTFHRPLGFAIKEANPELGLPKP